MILEENTKSRVACMVCTITSSCLRLRPGTLYELVLFGASIWLRVRLRVRACCTCVICQSLDWVDLHHPHPSQPELPTSVSACMLTFQPVCRSDRVMFLIGQPSASFLSICTSSASSLAEWRIRAGKKTSCKTCSCSSHKLCKKPHVISHRCRRDSRIAHANVWLWIVIIQYTKSTSVFFCLFVESVLLCVI